MANSVIGLAETHKFQKLFIAQLHWAAPDHAPVVILGEDGISRTATNVSSYAGIRVWVCPDRPGAKLEAQIDRALSKVSTDRIVIFHTADEQVWRWPVRRQIGQSVTARLTSHRHRNGQPNPKFQSRLDTITLPTDRILDANTVVAKVRAAFDVETQNETKHASQLMARMYAAMEKAYPTGTDPRQRDHDISLTLARVLFLMFGDDTEMWRTDAFRDFIHHHTAASGSGLADQLDLLFTHLNTAEPTGTESPDGFRYVNGGIFAEHLNLPELGKDFRDVILQACAVDWSTISPAIFGSMFQSVRDAETRRRLGEHYTSEENILKTLNPLFLDELRGDLTAALTRDTTTKQLNALNALWKRLGDLRFMDPACGCGNFIIVAYRELRDIELQVMEALLDRQHGADQMTLGGELVRGLRVTLDHFYGIEIDEWPARIAETAMYLIDRQCDLRLRDRFGEAPERLPITRQARIVADNALRLDWSELCPPSANLVIAGNPPFLGHATRTPGQAADLRTLWKRDDIGRLDYVTGWYAKALGYLGTTEALWAFVSTNSIVQGEPAPTLFGAVFSAGWRIKFGHRTFQWSSEAGNAAGVQCVIVGFTRRPGPARLFEYSDSKGSAHELSVNVINEYLADGPPIGIAQRRTPLSPAVPPVSMGSMPRDNGFLIVEVSDYHLVQGDPVALKYVRPLRGSRELLHNEERWCLWLVDLDPADIKRSPFLTARLEQVRRFRLQSTAVSTRQMATTPHLFGQRSQPVNRYLAIPKVFSERRLYFTADWLPAETIASDLLYKAEDPDGYLFAIISSSMFLTWQKTIGGALESRPRFANTITWNNFPLPELSPDRHKRIVTAGQAVLAARALHPEKSLAQHYEADGMTPELLAAHEELDLVMDQAFGSPTRCATERERQRLLFLSYRQLADRETLPLADQRTARGQSKAAKPRRA